MQAWNGMFGLAPHEGIISPDYTIFRLRNCINNPQFFVYLFKTDQYVLQFLSRSRGMGTGFLRLNTAHFNEVEVILPSKSEQIAIVRFLEHADARIRRAVGAKRRLIALLNEEKQAIIHHAVTRGLEPDVPLKPSGVEWLGDVPAHWQVLPLKVICLIQTGITLGKRYADEILVEYPYLRVANVQAGHLDLSDITTIALPKNEAERTVLQPGDVLMTEGGDIDKLGRSCIWEGQITPCLHQNHIFAVRPFKDRLLPQYLTRLLGSEYARTYFLKTAKQTTNLASTNKTTIGQFPVLHPGLEEQDRILTVIEEEMRPIRHAITATQREIDLLLEFRTRLIADVVTGKLDVRGVAAGLPETTPGQTTLDAFDAPAGDEEDTWPEPGAALEDDAGIGA